MTAGNSADRAPGEGGQLDPFDRLYAEWAEKAFLEGAAAPARDRWDAIVLRLLESDDPERTARYRRLEAPGEGTLGGDAYHLWEKIPDGTPGKSVPLKDWPSFRGYMKENLGSMRRYMEAQGLGERYSEIIAEYEEYLAERRKRAKKGQQSVLIIGCVGMGAILLMMLTVLLIIGLQMMK